MQTLEFEKKILLIGDASVGKTSLVRRFVIDKFDDKYVVTIGTKTSRKPMDFRFEAEQMHINLQLDMWDILGQSGMERAHKVYFKGAESFILVCDGTRRSTFETIPRWMQEVSELAGPIAGVLACNKVDIKEQFQVTPEELQATAAQYNMAVFWTSAKTGENVEACFQRVGEQLCVPILKKYAGGGAPAAEPAAKKKGFFKR